MTATTATAQYAPAQVGKGRTAHKTDAEEFSTDTLCERMVTRVLTPAEAAKMKECVSCNRIAEERAAAPAEQDEAPAPVEKAPAAEVEETEEAAATEDAPAEDAPAAEVPAVEEAPADAVRLTVRSYRRAGGSVVEQRALLHVNCDCKLASTLVGTFDNMADARTLAAELVPNGPELGECSFSQPLTQAAAEEAATEEASAVEEAPAAPAADVEETPEFEDAPAAVEETPAGDQVEVTAYTAALEVLHANGQDSDTRVLTLDAAAMVETVAKMRRMPRWNAAEERFTVNKVAVIVARDAQGERVWVRGEAAPIRVDFTGAPVQEDAPAEAGAVDMAAVLAATRVLRRRKEVQRVIDNREAARAWSAPTSKVEEPAPTPEEASAPVAEQPETTAAAPEWRTLKGLETPFLLYGEESDGRFHPANDRKQCTGEPLVITRTWMSSGTRYGEDSGGREIHLWGVATKYWVAPAA
ncbi:hypothetical protein OHA04_27515 [Streptomyces sp. NBC_01590]|uniref:hypothetical protein n=1 Tax=Streptomyces sp. NBC_01590 TaxID=2975887 RepID=UPI003867252D